MLIMLFFYELLGLLCVYLFLFTDIRVNYCFTKFENGRCTAPKPQNTSKEACCCTRMPGQGWGDPCEICPPKDQGVYYFHSILKTQLHEWRWV